MEKAAETIGSETLVDILSAHARERGNVEAFTFLSETESPPITITYADLDKRARQIAALLQRMGAVGERVLILLNTSREYVESFYGCFYAGAIAVPAFPPSTDGRPIDRLKGIIADSGAKFALVDSALLQMKDELLRTTPSLSSLRLIAADQVVAGTESLWKAPSLSGETIAFLQYTSGSTGNPKGVTISHSNLIQNSKVIQGAMHLTPSDRGFAWLPIYHDLGLISAVVHPVFVGFPSILCAPTWFIRKPERWVEAISKYRISLSGGPNFAFELCLRRLAAGITPSNGLDLSSWKIAFNGAEPVRSETLRRFAEAFGPYGFRPEMFHICYGMAEATLMVGAGRRGLAPVVCSLDRAALIENRVNEVSATFNEQSKIDVVASGEPRPGLDVRIVNPETCIEVGPDEIGEIWISGGNISKGYWNRVEESEATFGAKLPGGDTRYFRSGDTGFIRNGCLFAVGRVKELLIIRGKNHYPHDIERTVEACHPLLRGCVSAVFSVDVENEERLALVIEAPKEDVRVADMLEPIRRALVEIHDLRLHAITLIRRGALPRTSSAKVMRLKTRALFLAGKLQPIDACVNPTASGTSA